jgi:hypothetical protein
MMSVGLKVLCKDALDLWGKVEAAWDILRQLRDYRPLIVDAYMECMDDFREHRGYDVRTG